MEPVRCPCSLFIHEPDVSEEITQLLWRRVDSGGGGSILKNDLSSCVPL